MRREESGSVADFLAAMEFEEQMYLNLLFEHYESCVLLFARAMEVRQKSL